MAVRALVKEWWDLIGIALIAAVLLLSRLDAPLLEPDESRYAEIPRLMVRTGDWITPKLQGKPYNDKPPLVYWLIAGSYEVFGVSIESARLVPALAGWLTLLVIYFWTRKHFDRLLASLTCLILLSMLGYVVMTRMLLLDGVFAFLVISSLLSGHHALTQNRHPGWWLISALVCGLAVLAKGPVAVVLVTPALFALRWLDRSLPPVRIRDCVWYGAVVFAIALPWYAAMLLTNESFGSEHFFRHHIRRFLDPAHHERPFWFYLPAFVLEIMPWSFLGIPLLARWRVWSGNERFLLFFSFFCFVFFSIARAKLPTYLLPMLPICGILLANQLRCIWKEGIGVMVQQLLLGMSLLIMLLALGFRSWGLHWANDPGVLELDRAALVVAALFGLLLMLVLARWRLSFFGWSQRDWAFAGSIVMGLFVSWRTTHRAIPEYSEQASIVKSCLQMAALAEKEGIPYAAYRNSWDAVSFQLKGEELTVISSREQNQLSEWLARHPRCLVWMREHDKKPTEFTEHLPAGIEIERAFDLGKIQAFVLNSSRTSPSQPVTSR
jgi:dolichol-phosphate mannosyltransferase